MSIRTIKMKMPDLATNEGAELMIVSWHAAPGDRLRRGQLLLEVETDKSTMEVESIVEGILREQLVEAGGSVPVGEPIAVIEVE